MWYENNKEEWIERGKPNAQIEKNASTGEYRVLLYHLIGSGGKEVITKGALVLINGLYQPGVGGSLPQAKFNTEQDAIDAYNDYRRRNPIYSKMPEDYEVVKEMFE